MKVSAHAISVVIHRTQIILGFGIPLFRRFMIPSERFSIVLAHAMSVVIHHP